MFDGLGFGREDSLYPCPAVSKAPSIKATTLKIARRWARLSGSSKKLPSGVRKENLFPPQHELAHG